MSFEKKLVYESEPIIQPERYNHGTSKLKLDVVLSRLRYIEKENLLKDIRLWRDAWWESVDAYLKGSEMRSFTMLVRRNLKQETHRNLLLGVTGVTDELAAVRARCVDVDANIAALEHFHYDKDVTRSEIYRHRVTINNLRARLGDSANVHQMLNALVRGDCPFYVAGLDLIDHVQRGETAHIQQTLEALEKVQTHLQSMLLSYDQKTYVYDKRWDILEDESAPWLGIEEQD